MGFYAGKYGKNNYIKENKESKNSRYEVFHVHGPLEFYARQLMWFSKPYQ